jgi:hypothetical protein
MRVFISHSSHDAALAAAIADLIRAGLRLRTAEVRCSSSSDLYSPDAHSGKSVSDNLRAEIEDAAVFFCLLTKNSLHSPYVWLELGARWARKQPVLALRTNVEVHELPAPLQYLHIPVLEPTSAHRVLRQLVHDVGRKLEQDVDQQGLEGELPTASDLVSMSTPESVEEVVFIGNFPGFLPEIAELVGSASRELRILCDVPTYGHFSNHQEWKKYREAISNRINNEAVNVQIVVLNQSLRREALAVQFPGSTHRWDLWRQNHAAQLKAFFQRRGKPNQIDNLEKEGFLAELTAMETEVLRELATGKVDVRLSHAHMPVYAWLADGKRAIFAIPSFIKGASEFGFSTTSPNFVRALNAIIDGYNSRSDSIT